MVDLVPTGPNRELTGTGGLTHAGQMLGTPDFIAPEQIADAQGADIRADIYSLGCTLYYLLSGRPPFQAATLYDILQAHRLDGRPAAEPRAAGGAGRAGGPGGQDDGQGARRRFQTPSEVAKALAPFFKKPAAASVSPKPEVATVLAPDASRAATEPTQSGPDVAAPSALLRRPRRNAGLVEPDRVQGDRGGDGGRRQRGEAGPSATAMVVAGCRRRRAALG